MVGGGNMNLVSMDQMNIEQMVVVVVVRMKEL